MKNNIESKSVSELVWMEIGDSPWSVLHGFRKGFISCTWQELLPEVGGSCRSISGSSPVLEEKLALAKIDVPSFPTCSQRKEKKKSIRNRKHGGSSQMK